MLLDINKKNLVLNEMSPNIQMAKEGTMPNLLSKMQPNTSYKPAKLACH